MVVLFQFPGSTFGYPGWRAGIFLLLVLSNALASAAFVNFETAPIHPVALSADGNTLAVCNLPDGRVELFDVSSGVPQALGAVAVGVDPVSVRFRTANELWVVNHISSSISIVDTSTRRVVATLDTRSGPADVVFAGSPVRAFVSCAKEDVVQVFDPLQRQVVTNVMIDGDRPKALAVSPDGQRVYAAIFESGNASTILAGGGVTSDPAGPYGGQIPVPNEGMTLNPSLNRDPWIEGFGFDYIETLHDSIIVRRNAAGRWMDGNNGDWTEFVSGTNAVRYGRMPGWDMPDRDLAAIDTSTYEVSYASGLMNICMDAAVNPASGRIAVVGTDGINERRFEPKLRGIFVRVKLALIDPVTLDKTVVDLNPHLDYSTSSAPASVRDLSVGDPRGIIWNVAGTRAYITGMGSRNLIVIDSGGQRTTAQPLELGEGPTGMVLDEARGRLYVLNRFSATISVIDTADLTIVTNVPFFDPTPLAIKDGRKHLYDTRRNSGLGQASCGSCHVDARFDRLGWDLGNPAGPTIMGNGIFHPMKGPLVTQTLQDIFAVPGVGLHWRADRSGLEAFNPTFTDLLGADRLLTTNEMEEFKQFLATIHFPPNRFRNFDNSLPANVPLPGFFGFGPEAELDHTPLPNGNAVRGREIFTDVSSCASCHDLAAGLGTGGDNLLIQRFLTPLKVAQLRSFPDKVGMDRAGTSSRAGFGFGFDGRDDSLLRFMLTRDLSFPRDHQSIADLTAFFLAFAGNGNQYPDHPEYNTSHDAPAAVGRQMTLTASGPQPMLNQMIALADLSESRVDLVARGVKDGLDRGWFYDRSTGQFQSDRNEEQIGIGDLLALASPETQLTFTVVPQGAGRRMGADRDGDHYLDRSEIESGFDPADALSRGTNMPPQLATFTGVRVHPGMPVSQLFSATDPDAGQRVTLSLTREIPAGASFDSETGQFDWTPTNEQGDRLWRVGVRATDDGVPPLSDSAVLEIKVILPRVKRFAVGTDFDRFYGALVTIEAVYGRYYQLQYKDRLDDPDWTNTGEWSGAYDREITLRDYHHFPAYPHRFYRVGVFISH